MNLYPRTQLETLSAALSPEQQMSVVQILKDADLARCLKNTTIHKELHRIRRTIRGGKIKRVLRELANHENTQDGVDFLFSTNFDHTQIEAL